MIFFQGYGAMVPGKPDLGQGKKGETPHCPVSRETLQWIGHRFGPLVKFDEPMANHTSFKVGGPARVFATPTDEAQLTALIQRAIAENIFFRVIGRGTNLLVADKGIDGMVIRMAGDLARIKATESNGPNAEIKAFAGAPLAGLCRLCLANGFAGFNFALGIPGTVGGALRFNAGTRAGNMAQNLTSARVLEWSKQRGAFEARMKTPRELGLAYRRCGLDQGAVFLSAAFQVTRGDRDKLKKQARKLMLERKKNQPQKPSAGSFFKNPVNGPAAGKLIQDAGLKGVCLGGARVSERHANFIVNTGGATAAQILALSEKVAKTVQKQFGVTLEREVVLLGDFT